MTFKKQIGSAYVGFSELFVVKRGAELAAIRTPDDKAMALVFTTAKMAQEFRDSDPKFREFEIHMSSAPVNLIRRLQKQGYTIAADYHHPEGLNGDPVWAELSLPEGENN